MINLLRLLQQRSRMGLKPDDLEEQEAEKLLPNVSTPERDLEELYKDPESLETYKRHIQNTPTREQYGPSKMDRAIAAFRTTMLDRGTPGDPHKRMMDMLDRPYRQAVEEHDLQGKGLGESVRLEESSLNRQRLGVQDTENRAERKRASEENSEIRRQQLESQMEQAQIRADDADATREERAAASAEANETKLEIARMNNDLRRDLKGMGGQTDTSDKGWQIKEDAQGNLIRINARTGETAPTGVQGKPSDRAVKASEALDESLTQAKTLKQLVDKFENTTALGPLQGKPSRFVNRYVTGDKDKSNLYGLIDTIRNMNLYQMSGAQINNKEFERLKATLADENATEASIKADLDRFISSAERQRQRFKDRGTWSEEGMSSETPVGRERKLRSGRSVIVEEE